MGLVSGETVRRRLRGLSDERFVAFIGALWRARGAETRVLDADGDTERDPTVVEVRRADRTSRLGVVTGRRLPPGVTQADLDALVLSHPSSAVRGTEAFVGRVVDADDLHAMLLYAVPRSAADDLCRAFFDRPLAAESSPGRAATVTMRAPEHSASLVVGLLGLVLLVASVFGGPMLYGGTDPVFGAPDSVAGDPNDAADQVETTDRGANASESTPFESESFPPGLGPNGVVDHGALADGHANAVTGRSYRLTITHREYVDGRPTAYRRETVFVERPTVYRTELEGAGRLERGPLVVSSVEAFADGETRYQRRVVADEFDRTYTVSESPVRGVRNGEGRYADRVEQYVDWYLSVSESAIVDSFERDGTRYYWVRLGADPYAGVENSTGSALVDEDGVVHEIARQYDYPGSSGVSARVSIRYTDVGSTTVTPPAWYEERVGNATEGQNATVAVTNATATAGTPEATTPRSPTPTHNATATTATAT